MENCTAILLINVLYRCQCNVDWYGAGPYTIRKDANYITNHTKLPIHKAEVELIGTTELQTALSFVRLQIGPLICREGISENESKIYFNF